MELNIHDVVTLALDNSLDVQAIRDAENQVAIDLASVGPTIDSLVVDASDSIDSHVDLTSKPSIDAYTLTKELELDSHTSSNKIELDDHTALKESQIDTHASLATAEIDASRDEAEDAAAAAITARNRAIASADSSDISQAASAEHEINALYSRQLARDWATKDEDVAIVENPDVGSGIPEYSARHWALKAAELVGQGIIDDSNQSSFTVYSSDKVVELNDLKLDLSGGALTGPLSVTSITSSGNINGRNMNTDGAKLDSIEASATADQTGAEIKIAYESEPDTNEYSDSEKAYLATVPSLIDSKQDTLVSELNIKTINGENLLSAGDLIISAGSGGFAANLYFSNTISTIDGSYKTLSYTPDPVATTETISCVSGETAGSVYLFELPIDTAIIDSGKWLANFHSFVDSKNGESYIRYEGFMKDGVTGVETTIFTATSRELTTDLDYREWYSIQSTVSVDPTARYGIRVFANTTSNTLKDVTYTIGGEQSSYTNTPLATRHDQLRDRNSENQHSIGSITLLQENLDIRGSYTESAIEPLSPKVGDEWLDTINEILYKRISDLTTSAWIQIGKGGKSFTSSTRGPINVTSDVLVQNSFRRVFVNAINNDVTVTLPSPIGNNNDFSVTRIDSGASIVDVNGLINLLDGETVDLASDGTQWRIV